MRGAMLILSIMIVILLSGCATSGHWEKQGGCTEQEFQKEKYECSYRAQQLCNYWDRRTDAIVGAICVSGRFRECMSGSGYYWVEDKR